MSGVGYQMGGKKQAGRTGRRRKEDTRPTALESSHPEVKYNKNLSEVGNPINVTESTKMDFKDKQLLQKTRRTLTVVLVAFLTVLPACSNTPEASPPPPSSEPRMGGQLVFAVNDFPSSWNPASSAWSGPATTMARTFLDPLVVINERGEWSPYLADFISNDDFTSWLIKLKEGVKFHNGESLNADVLVANLENARAGIVLGPPLRSVTDITVEDPLTVRIVLSERHANFPFLFTSQGGYVFAQETLERFKTGDTSNPIGTGPWQMQAQDPNRVVVTKNPNYWRSDANGTQYPYIQRVTFRYAPDLQTRKLGIENQDFDAVLENTPRTLVKWIEGNYPEGFSLLIDDNYSDRTYGNFNTQTGVFGDIRLREAIVLGTDRNAIAQLASDGFFPPTDGPYSSNSRWFSPSGWPEISDVAKARSLVTQWTAEAGAPPPVNLVVSQGVLNLAVGQELKKQWDNLGFKVTLSSYPTEQFIVKLVQGAFDVLVVQQFTSVDPVADESFWRAQTVAEPGGIGLNFPRFTNDIIEQALEQGRATKDYQTRKAGYATVWEEWAKRFPYLFLYNSQIAVLSSPRVSNMGSLQAGDATQALRFSWGATWLTETWLK